MPPEQRSNEPGAGAPVNPGSFPGSGGAIARVLVLGAGYSGSRVARLARARGLGVRLTVRSDERAAKLRDEGFEVEQSAVIDSRVTESAGSDTHVVVAYQPDPETDARIAPSLARAGSVVYLSSTGVYGGLRGRVDDATPVPEPDARARRLLDAEGRFRDVGATVLRCPGIYGPDRGVHVRILRGDYRMPGDGSHMLSRIHAEDLAVLCLAAAGRAGETYVVGDERPAPHGEVARFVCDAYGVAMPESVPLESVHATLRADRQVDGSRALRDLGVRLRFPTYREGMSPEATGLRRGATSE